VTTVNNIPIVLFDDECIFCNTSVNFLINHENSKEPKLKFAALNSSFGKQLKLERNINIDSILFFHNNQLLFKSDAVLSLVGYLKFPYSLMKIGYLIPKSLRDRLYDFIAKNRYRIFKNDTCIIPNEEIKARFILN
jgi:predicted DCC family thiol-disulfide oxidoreductase YuxK